VDDIIVKSDSCAQHIKDLHEVFQALRHHGIRLNPDKCAFRVKGGKLLGFMLTHRSIEANLEKSRSEVLQAHLYILNNTDEVIPYIDAHKAIVKANNPRQLEKWILMQHNITFMPSFKDEVLKDSTASETLTRLATRLKFDVNSCTGYEVNNCIFYTKSMDEKSTVQNFGITLEAESMQFSTSKDTNLVVG